jgi:anti-anti-sigma factor
VPHCSVAPFRCERHFDGDRQHVVAIGEIDVATGPYLTDVIRAVQAHALHVVLDLDQTTFIDAGGARILLAADARARAATATFAISGATAPVVRLLALIGAKLTIADSTSPPSEGAGDGARADFPHRLANGRPRSFALQRPRRLGSWRLR